MTSTQQNTTSPNVTGGYHGNIISPTVVGASIGGGGNSSIPNRVWSSYAAIGGRNGNTASAMQATIGGGSGNTAGGSGNSLMTIGGGYSNTASGFYATVGGGSTNTASGDSATVSGGSNNTASENVATVGGGSNNTASKFYATVPGGLYAVASHYGEMAYASGRFSSDGDAQTSTYVLRNQTVDGTQTELFLGPSNMFNRITLASDRTLVFDILVVGRSVGGNSAGYHIRGVIERVGATTSFIGSPSVTTLGEDRSAWSVTVDDDDFIDALLKVTGEAGFDIHWVATVRTAEVAH